MPAEEPNPVDDKLAFIIADTQRGGTTSLDLYLPDHPRISMAATRKELHVFDPEEHFGTESVDYCRLSRPLPAQVPATAARRCHAEQRVLERRAANGWPATTRR